MNQPKTLAQKAGFTLIELSIVLVIIGLIVGGVLVGQDLIKAATIRKSVSQIEGINTAVNTFANKYNGLPGDLVNATTFFSAVQNAGGNGAGDGDRLIEGVSAADTLCSTAATPTTCLSGEPTLAWYMLSQANLLANAITLDDYDNFTFTPSDSNTIALASGRGAKISMMAVGGRNYFAIGNWGTVPLVAGSNTFTAAMSPIEALQIDSKMDDGAPHTGIIGSVALATALPGAAANGANSPTAGVNCYDDNSTPPAYATSTAALANGLGCSLGVLASF